MLIITDNSFNLIKYHVRDSNDICNLQIIYTSKIKDITDALIQSVVYTEKGELVTPLFIIKYEGKHCFKNFQSASNTIVYLVVKDIRLWSHFRHKSFKDKVTFLDVKASQYKYRIAGVDAILEPSAVPYFWSEYCIKKFNTDPNKWYNEVRYLMCKFAEVRKKFSCLDLDCIYNKISDTVNEYLNIYMYTNRGKNYISKMTMNEKFIVFVAPKGRKSLFLRNIERNKPDFLLTYMIFREAVMASTIRLADAVYILDYLLNKENINSVNKIRNLFNLR